jgi:hypothetical protein
MARARKYTGAAAHRGGLRVIPRAAGAPTRDTHERSRTFDCRRANARTRAGADAQPGHRGPGRPPLRTSRGRAQRVTARQRPLPLKLQKQPQKQPPPLFIYPLTTTTLARSIDISLGLARYTPPFPPPCSLRGLLAFIKLAARMTMGRSLLWRLPSHRQYGLPALTICLPPSLHPSMHATRPSPLSDRRPRIVRLTGHAPRHRGIPCAVVSASASPCACGRTRVS